MLEGQLLQESPIIPKNQGLWGECLLSSLQADFSHYERHLEPYPLCPASYFVEFSAQECLPGDYFQSFIFVSLSFRFWL